METKQKRKWKKKPTGLTHLIEHEGKQYILTNKQLLFVKEYCIDKNGSQAALRVGYKPHSAGAIATENLKKPIIKALINKELEAVKDKLDVTKEKVLKEFCRIAFFDPRKLFDSHGNLIPIHKLDEDTARAIGGLDIIEDIANEDKESILKKLKFIDKKGALDSLARYFGLFNDKLSVEQTIKVIIRDYADDEIIPVEAEYQEIKQITP